MSHLKTSTKDLSDDEKLLLIQSVQKYPIIWDRTDVEFKTSSYKSRRKQAWQEICTHSFGNAYNSEFMKAKWEGLRKVFRQEQKKLMERASHRTDSQEIEEADVNSLKWKFFKDMTFLNESLFTPGLESTSLANQSMYSPNSKPFSIDNYLFKTITTNSTQLNQNLKNVNFPDSSDSDCDIKMWLSSLAPHFYELQEYKLEIQTEIMNVLLRYKKLKENKTTM